MLNRSNLDWVVLRKPSQSIIRNPNSLIFCRPTIWVLFLSIFTTSILHAQEYADWTQTSGDAAGTGTFACAAGPDFTWTLTGSVSASTNIDSSETYDGSTQFETDYGEADSEENYEVQIPANTNGVGNPIDSSATLTINFDSPTPAGGWGFSAHDMDVDQLVISALDASGIVVPTATLLTWPSELHDANGTGDDPFFTSTDPGLPADSIGITGSDDPDGIFNSVISTGSATSEAGAIAMEVTTSVTQITFRFDAIFNGVTASYHTYIASGCGDVDYGDAPDAYRTTQANAPKHVINETNDLFIGSTIDGEVNGQPNVAADGDGADEDGITFSSPGGGPHAEVIATVPVTNDTGSPAIVCAWMDRWGAGAVLGGSFLTTTDAQDGDRCQSIADGGETVNFRWTGMPNAVGHTYLRFRLCQIESNCDTPRNTIVAAMGEVQDHRIFFDFDTTAVTIGNVELDAISLQDFLGSINLASMSDEDLFELLNSWDSEIAADLEHSDRAVLIAAILTYLDPDQDNTVAILKWETLYQHGTIGFDVERQISNGEWIKINLRLLPALLSPLGGEYSLLDPDAISGSTYRYQIVEHEAKGGTNRYGPYEVVMH